MARVSWRKMDSDVYHEAGNVAPALRLSLSAGASTSGVIRAFIPLRLLLDSLRPVSDSVKNGGATSQTNMPSQQDTLAQWRRSKVGHSWGRYSGVRGERQQCRAAEFS